MSQTSLKGTSLLAAVASMCAIGVATPGHTAHHRTDGHAVQMAEENYEYGDQYGADDKDKEKQQQEHDEKDKHEHPKESRQSR